jgi:hypothetical protein
VLDFIQTETVRNIVTFFRSRLTLIDFLIIGLGVFLIFYQIGKRLTAGSKRFCQRAEQDPLYVARVEVTLNYISALIELLPVLGLLGTVWGLMNALSVIASKEMPTIKDIATYIAPALSTTFFGLIFAVFNLLIFDFLQAYFSELIAWYRQTHPQLAIAQAGAKTDSARPENVKKTENIKPENVKKIESVRPEADKK